MPLIDQLVTAWLSELTKTSRMIIFDIILYADIVGYK